jgi:hypothetical protein
MNQLYSIRPAKKNLNYGEVYFTYQFVGFAGFRFGPLRPFKNGKDLILFNWQTGNGLNRLTQKKKG